MRFLDLQLLRFGPFTDLTLDFETDGAGLHLIFGSNEAGKSTTLRAIAGLLFGIPETTADDHLHGKPDLRIGARLQTRAGARVAVVRRKGRVNTLLDPQEDPLDEAVLGPFLGGVSRELFETMFGLSHEALVRGGQELLEGRGELGESLFGAGLGVRGLHGVRTALQKEVAALFAPRAQNPPLNQAIKAFKEAKKRSEQLSLKPREWQDLQDRVQTAAAELAERERERERVLTELNRLERLRRVLGPLRKREDLLRRQAELGAVVPVPTSCGAERIRAQQTLREGCVRERRLAEERDACARERASLEVPTQLLAREAAIEELRDRLGAHRKAMRDLPGLEGGVAAAREDARGILAELGRGDSLAEAERLRLDAANQARVQALGKQGIKLCSELDRAHKDVAGMERRLAALRRGRDELPLERDGAALRRAAAEARRRGDLEAQLRKLEAETAGIEERVGTQLAALSLWQGRLEQVAALPLPPVESVERFRAGFEALAGEQRLAQQQREKVQRQIAETAAHIATLEGEGAVPSEAEVQAARERREAHWREIRLEWLEGGPNAAPEALARRYEQAVHDADEAADRLWREAERAARHAHLVAERRRQEAEAARLDECLRGLAERKAELGARWRALWTPAGIEPLPPAEMRAWLARHERLAEAVPQLRERARERDALRSAIEAQRRRCSEALVALGEASAGAGESLSGLLQRAEELVAAIEEAEDRRRQVLRDLQRAADEQREHADELARCERAVGEWRSAWGRAVAPLGLGEDAAVEEAEAILGGLARLFKKLDEMRRDQARIDAIGRDARRFAGEVAELARACAPDLEPLTAEEAAAGLIERLKAGRERLESRNQLDQRLQRIHAELEDLRCEREGAQAVLDALMAQAGVGDPDGLEEAERRSDAHRELVAKLRDLDEQLLAEGLPIEELVAQAGAVDPDRLPAEIAALGEETERLAAECAGRREAIGGLRKELDAMDGSEQAADAAAEAQEALARIKAGVEVYVRLKLSAVLLDREIERYRERNQGPIVRRAGELFRHMTLGAFAGLGSGFGDGDRPVLLALRDDGRKVGVAGLSEGTRDQLYLALRLASLERHLQGNEPTPLVVDDILINFDDRRARATLELLGELSEKTQILFFTHHAQLLELARDAVPAGLFREHDLDRLGRAGQGVGLTAVEHT